MRLYEEVFIVKPDAADEEAESVIEQLSKTVTDQGGTIDHVDRWGRRKLAYRVAKYDEGNYVVMKFSAKPETVREVERRLRVNDLVLKFLTVRLDERLKWVEKRKKRREERAKRKPPAPVAAAIPAIPAAAAPGAPAMPAPPEPAEKAE
jgi:small subunit ribosomal protein S6